MNHPWLPRVLVVIPTLNEEAHVEAVILQLLSDTSIGFDVVVADGGSTDKTVEIVEGLAKTHPTVRLITNPQRTQAAAMNLMLQPGYEADVLIRADAHASYPPNFVSNLVRSLEDSGAASVVIPMDAVATNSCFQRGNAWIADSKLGAGGAPHRGGRASGFVDHGHHAAFTMNSFRAIGGYDIAFIANEDAEYDHRLVQAGHRIWLDGRIRIKYFPRATPSSLWRQYFRYGWGRAQNCFKHKTIPKPRQLIPVVHVFLVAVSLFALPFSAFGLLWPAFYLSVIAVAGGVMALKHRSICGLAGIFALAICHAAWGLGFVMSSFRQIMR